MGRTKDAWQRPAFALGLAGRGEFRYRNDVGEPHQMVRRQDSGGARRQRASRAINDDSPSRAARTVRKSLNRRLWPRLDFVDTRSQVVSWCIVEGRLASLAKRPANLLACPDQV